MDFHFLFLPQALSATSWLVEGRVTEGCSSHSTDYSHKFHLYPVKYRHPIKPIIL